MHPSTSVRSPFVTSLNEAPSLMIRAQRSIAQYPYAHISSMYELVSSI